MATILKFSEDYSYLASLLLLHIGAGNWWLSCYSYTENAKGMKVRFGLVFNNRGGFILSAPLV